MHQLVVVMGHDDVLSSLTLIIPALQHMWPLLHTEETHMAMSHLAMPWSLTSPIPLTRSITFSSEWCQALAPNTQSQNQNQRALG